MTRVQRHMLCTVSILAVVVTSGCPGPQTPEPIWPFQVSLVECPHDWIPHLNPDSLVEPGQLALPGRLTNIPEFQDCQKLIVRGTGINEFRYLPIAGIFGAWDLAPRWDSVEGSPAGEASLARPVLDVKGLSGVLAGTVPLQLVIVPPLRTPGGPPGPSAQNARGFVEIVSEGTYAPLGIGPGFNCAFLYFAGSVLQARMVHYLGQREPDCRAAVDPDTLEGAVLSVIRTPDSRHTQSADYPAAARWDWDPVNEIQYFGVKCGAALCEVGPQGFQPSPSPNISPTAIAADPDKGSRAWRIKGWFDAQRLAPATGSNLTGPGAGGGVVFPDPSLWQRKVVHFQGTWLPVAKVVLDAPGYSDKWNLAATSLDGPSNRVYLCGGTWPLCREAASAIPDATIASVSDPDANAPVCSTPDPMVQTEDVKKWWAAIVAPGGRVRFSCVIRRDHQGDFGALGLSALGFVRWRWRAADETIWISCDAGCCEVEVPCSTC